MADKKRSKTKSSREKASHCKGSDSRWSSKVTTISTFPPEDLYTRDAETIARVMATKKVSPKGLGSAIRMVQFYINRAGKNLTASRKRELEKAKTILQEKAAQRNLRRARVDSRITATIKTRQNITGRPSLRRRTTHWPACDDQWGPMVAKQSPAHVSFGRLRSPATSFLESS